MFNSVIFSVVFEVCAIQESVCQISVIRIYREPKNLFSISMKRTYSRLSSELIQLDVEMGFMSASIVEKPYDDGTTSGHELNEVNLDSGEYTWNNGDWE